MSYEMVIVCVDDEQIVLKSLENQLRSHYGQRYTLEFAEDGQEGLEIIQELSTAGKNVVAVISDWLMPGMRGDEFLIEVHKILPDTVKIMLTGHADPQAIKNARENANLYQCISKPWDAKILTDTIDDALSSYSTSN